MSPQRSFSSNSSSSQQTLPPNSPLYDPRTNEPAGLRQVLDGLKRMEAQVTNIENDVDALKNIVKKIRESNGLTEKRLDKIEDFADTMQQDLYLTMDMVRSLTDVLSESKTAAAIKPKEK
jgi:peptidoglycan hydrolase CwlO-like protein